MPSHERVYAVRRPLGEAEFSCADEFVDKPVTLAQGEDLLLFFNPLALHSGSIEQSPDFWERESVALQCGCVPDEIG